MPDEVRQDDFEVLYLTHFRDVYRFLVLSVVRGTDVDDLASETFLRAYRAWSGGRKPKGRPLPWLIAIARHAAIDNWRRAQIVRRLPVLPDVATPVPEPQHVVEFRLWMDSLSEALPARQREVLILRYFKDLEDSEIGEVLGLSPSGVRSLAARAIGSLRRHPDLLS